MHHNFKELKIWQKAIDLAIETYSATATFPSEEKYGLTSQIRRSAVSIPSNISEGAGRNSSKEFAQFLSIAHGSSYELQTQIIISQKLNLISDEISNNLQDKISEVQKMNYRLRESLTGNRSVK